MAPLDADASDSDSDSHPAREASESIKLRMRRLTDWLAGWLDVEISIFMAGSSKLE